MAHELIALAVRDRIATISICNPPLNVLTYDLRLRLMDHLLQLQSNTEVSVLIIESLVEKAFSVGFDLEEFPTDEPGGLQMIRFAQHVLNAIFNLPQVTIVKLQGHVLGGGACLMLASDLRIATSDTKIGMPEIKVGAFSAGGGTHMLARQLGLARAKEVVLLGEPLTADEAWKAGLINRVMAREDLDAAASDVANRLAAMSRPALRAAKRSLNVALTGPFEAGQTTEAEGMASLFRLPDVFEGVSAFKQRRKPAFSA